MRDLVIVKEKCIFLRLEAVFTTPAKQVVCDESFSRGVYLAVNKDMIIVVPVLIPFTKTTTTLMKISESLSLTSNEYVLCKISDNQ